MYSYGNKSSLSAKLILVTSSPRRIELLRRLGFDFINIPPLHVEEITLNDPYKTVEYNAKKKVLSAVRSDLSGLYVGVDLVVYVDGRILGKPRCYDDACLMLKMLSGREHEVISGMYILDTNRGNSTFKHARTKVKFKELTEREINWYLSTNEWVDAAGAYKIQGRASLFIEAIEGDYYNVVGFPLHTFYSCLAELGYDPLGLIAYV